jgi:hypothetical protein
LREDGFIILAQATIRADGFRPRKFGEGLRAARANPIQIFRTNHPKNLDGVFEVNRTLGEKETGLEMPKTV